MKDTGCHLPCLSSVDRYVHVTPRCRSVDGNVDKLPAVDAVQPGTELHCSAVVADSSLVKDQVPLTKDVLKLDVDHDKTGAHIYVDESERKVVAYVNNAFMEVKAIELYKIIREMDTEQVCL